MQQTRRNLQVTLLTIWISVLALSNVGVFPAFSQYADLYQSFLNKGKAALTSKEYDRAFFYFDSAKKTEPYKQEPLKYIELIDRIRTGQVSEKDIERAILSIKNLAISEQEAPSSAKSISIQTAPIIVNAGKLQSRKQVEILDTEISAPPESKQVTESVRMKKEVEASIEPKQIKKARLKVLEPMTPPVHVKSSVIPPPQKKKLKFGSTLDLDEVLWQEQPNMILEIPLNKYIVLRGENIQRFLFLEPGVFAVERLKKDELKISPKYRGQTFLHLWDDRGRWTFHIKGMILLRLPRGDKALLAERIIDHEEPFRLSYSNNWNAYYRGNDVRNLTRQSLGFRQWIGLFGKTPYGHFSATANSEMFKETSEIVGQSIALSDGKIGPFKDFTIIGYDASTSLSQLTMPARSFRGGLIDAYAFRRKLKYLLFQGHDRATFQVLTPGSFEIKKSCVEGAKVTFFPDNDDHVSLNYARGWGVERRNELKDRVFSIEGQKVMGDVTIQAESAYDEDVFANTIVTNWKTNDQQLKIYIRDIDKNYSTIIGNPADRGEVGGNIYWRWKPGRLSVTSRLDLYRDRKFSNPESPDAVNIESSFNIYIPLNETFRWNNTLRYSNTEQLLSPRRSVQFGSTITKSIPIFNKRMLSVLFGYNFQRNRFSQNPQSEYDRNSLLAGIRTNLMNNLTFYANYEYSISEEISTGTKSHPSVISSGISYSHRIGESFYNRYSLTYRNEENSDTTFSFLSGTDSFGGTVSLSYRPNRDTEVFMDMSGRNVWAEKKTMASYNEADLRFGVRASWDTFFSWDPTGTIYGQVYKDLNENLKFDPDEPGIQGIAINVGQKKALTNRQGTYKVNVRAKKIKVALDVDSIPSGYVFTNDPSFYIPIEHGESQRVDFGFNVLTGITGVIFNDKNGNGKVDNGENYINRVVIVLDGREQAVTNHLGTYSFEDVKPGEHTIFLMLNTVPLKYMPKNKLKHRITVKEGDRITINFPMSEK